MITPAHIDALIGIVDSDNRNNINALTALLAVCKLIWDSSYPATCVAQDMVVIQKWFNYIRSSSVDLYQDDLGQLYRDIATIYNHRADNLRDEVHYTSVER